MKRIAAAPPAPLWHKEAFGGLKAMTPFFLHLVTSDHPVSITVNVAPSDGHADADRHASVSPRARVRVRVVRGNKKIKTRHGVS